MKSTETHSLQIRYTLFTVLACVLFVTALMPHSTQAVSFVSGYYSDIEEIIGNIFKTSFFDLDVTDQTIETLIGPQIESEYVHTSMVSEVGGSLNAQFEVHVAVDTSTSDEEFCNALMLSASRDGSSVYDSSFTAFSAVALNTVGETWEYHFNLPVGAPVSHGEVCNADIVFDAWREGVIKEESGFTDIERINVALTARMVVLNEIYPNPNEAWSYPNNTEWVEIQNTGDTAVDIAGWQISELSAGVETLYDIVASSPSSGEVGTLDGTTYVPAGGFVVVLFSGAKLNNTGDTVRLYEKMSDGSYRLLDGHSYGDYSGLSDLNLTPGDINIPGIGVGGKGKSEARIESGTGAWVDPFPTPGYQNSLIGTVLLIDTAQSSTQTNEEPQVVVPEAEGQEGIDSPEVEETEPVATEVTEEGDETSTTLPDSVESEEEKSPIGEELQEEVDTEEPTPPEETVVEEVEESEEPTPPEETVVEGAVSEEVLEEQVINT